MMVIVTLSNLLSATNNDAAVPIAKWLLRSLLKAEVEIIVTLHFEWTGSYKISVSNLQTET
jgi:hypothetical protein